MSCKPSQELARRWPPRFSTIAWNDGSFVKSSIMIEYLNKGRRNKYNNSNSNSNNNRMDYNKKDKLPFLLSLTLQPISPVTEMMLQSYVNVSQLRSAGMYVHSTRYEVYSRWMELDRNSSIASKRTYASRSSLTRGWPWVEALQQA